VSLVCGKTISLLFEHQDTTGIKVRLGPLRLPQVALAVKAPPKRRGQAVPDLESPLPFISPKGIP